MEPDFSIRNELDSISHRDESMDSILNRYPETSGNNSDAMSSSRGGVSSVPIIGGMLSSLQSSLGFLHRDNQFIKSKLGDSADEAGIKLVVGPDTLKWIVLLLVILIALVIFMKMNNRPRKNPLKKRLLALESEIKSLKRQNPFNV